jgi:hypothetical protein
MEPVTPSTAREHRCRMVVTLGYISHICGNWNHKPKPHGAAHGAIETQLSAE